MPITLDADTYGPLVGLKLRNPHAPKFRKAEAEIAKAKSEVVVLGIEFGEKGRSPSFTNARGSARGGTP